MCKIFNIYMKFYIYYSYGIKISKSLFKKLYNTRVHSATDLNYYFLTLNIYIYFTLCNV